MQKHEFENILNLLALSGNQNLADSFDMLSAKQQEAIAKMVGQMNERVEPRVKIADCVSEDVAAFLENREGWEPYCALYLEDEKAEEERVPYHMLDEE